MLLKVQATREREVEQARTRLPGWHLHIVVYEEPTGTLVAAVADVDGNIHCHVEVVEAPGGIAAVQFFVDGNVVHSLRLGEA